MEFPVRPEDVKVIQGASGRGLYVTCACGCPNWNHIEVMTSEWTCRNCGRVLSHYFPGLVQKVLQMQKPAGAPEASPAKA
jgi:hypothetical protein